MATAETNVLKRIMLALAGRSVLFRNNVGAAQALDGSGRIIRYGVCNPGGSDLIGWTKVTITPEMVGRTLAVFTAIEVKTARGRAEEHQKRFVENVRQAGGIAGVARSDEEARALVKAVEDGE